MNKAQLIWKIYWISSEPSIKFFNCHHTILGRMGLLVLLYLIQINLYKEVDAPSKRGFSSIETWFVGIQMPILVAILEYGMILALKKAWQSKDYKIFSVVDLCTFCLSVVYLIIFNGIFWLAWNTQHQLWKSKLARKKTFNCYKNHPEKAERPKKGLFWLKNQRFS